MTTANVNKALRELKKEAKDQRKKGKVTIELEGSVRKQTEDIEPDL